ncbi:MAG: GGDEF domain-containing protein [Hylemonella sp.]|nr:GGDEF domain-containing protein [Hylemonella sp.]
MQPEPRAIVLAATIASLALAVMLWNIAAGAHHARSARHWATGSALLSAGAMTNIMQNEIHFVVAIVLAIPAMVAGFSFLVLGVRRARGLHSSVMLLFLPVALMFGAAVYWSMVLPSFTARVIVHSILTAILAGALVWNLWPWRAGQFQAAAWFVMVPAALMTVIFAVRAVSSIVYEAEPIALAGPMTVFIYLTGSILFLAIQTGFVLLHQLLMLGDVHFAAHRDALTGVLNRRGLIQLVPPSMTGYAMLAIDLDHFKRINDEHGHEAGDKVLALTGNLLNKALREGDLASRMGGEEFCILLKEATPQVAMGVAERIRTELASQSMDLQGGPVTASTGIALAVPEESFDMLIRRADACLHRAKVKGRNRTEIATDVTPLDFESSGVVFS